jgi:hypothetical protein
MKIRVAIDDHVGKWEPGTILGYYDDDVQLNWGEYAHFLIFEVDGISDDDKDKIRKRKLKLDLNVELTKQQLKDAKRNKECKSPVSVKEIKFERKNRHLKATKEQYHVKDEIDNV